ncbi:MAG: hypothetical protein HQ547_02050 [Candidatus Omnitrophica bacterium]|nr:hypothetical protein [Candidatus Omnitrophota bacterium]
MLYFGDFDPSGNEMLEAMKTTLTIEMGLEWITFKRVALTKEDIFQYKLPHSPNALKSTDTRTQKHLEQYGALAVELDALRPDILEKKIRTAIEMELDMDLFRIQQRKEVKDKVKLAKLKKKIMKLMEYEN